MQLEFLDSALLTVQVHKHKSEQHQYSCNHYQSVHWLSFGIAHIHTFGLQHAPIAECKAEFPLIIFSHGIGGNRIAYSAIICSLVKQVSQALKRCGSLYNTLKNGICTLVFSCTAYSAIICSLVKQVSQAVQVMC